MSLNDKARAALKRELQRAFPERAANDPGHDRLAEALSKPTHTPGPWTANTFGSVRSQSGWLVAEVLHAESVEAGNANARLIAAAPDLLAALKGLLPMWSSGIDEPWVHAARAAIARATGGAK